VRTWPRLRDAFVRIMAARAIPMVVPSASAARLWRELEPRLGGIDMKVIAHGMADPGAPLAWTAPAAQERLRVLVLGRIAPNKGEILLRQAGRRLDAHTEMVLVGCGPGGAALAQEMGWQAIERYELGELHGILAGLAPHAALLASVVPETYSYTLSELQAMGVPPIATRLGAFEERIVDGQSGLLFEPTAQALLACVESLQRDPSRLASVAAALARAPRPRAPADMIDEYRQILALTPRPLARFRMAQHPATALTEAYAELDRAYHSLAAAYADTRRAYETADAAFKSRDRDYIVALADRDRLAAELDAMTMRRWAAKMVSTLRGRSRANEP
jgi:hypothetical protein